MDLNPRCKAWVLLRGGPPLMVTQDVEEVIEKLASHSDSELVEFTSLAHIGDAGDPRPTWDAFDVHIERASIYGCSRITKAKWDDQIRDHAQGAMVPRMALAGVSLPGS